MSARPQARSALFRSALAAHLVVLVVLGLWWPRAPLQPLDRFDQPFYIGIAYDIVHFGRFTDGYFFARDFPDGGRPSGMRFGPLYPAALAGLASVDPVLRRNIDCVVRSRGGDPGCGDRAPSVRWAQFGLLVLAFGSVWRIARLLMPGEPALAAVALAFALGTGPTLLASANDLMTETLAFALTTGGAEALVRSVLAGDRRPAARPSEPAGPPPGALAGAGAGALLGLASLCRPADAALIPAIAAGLAFVPAPRAERALRPLAFLAAAALVLAPWVIRNDLVFGRPGISFGYAAHTLAQRVSFDRMTGPEYARSFLCWLPDGNGFGRTLLGPHACDRFGWGDRRDTFYAIGMNHLVPDTRRAAGSDANWLPWLVRHELLAHPVRHALTTLPLALRGLCVAHWWGFVLGLVASWETVRAWRRRDRGFLALVLPAWLALALGAAIAVNQPRYNYDLIPPLAVAGALAIGRLAARVQRGSGIRTERRPSRPTAPS